MCRLGVHAEMHVWCCTLYPHALVAALFRFWEDWNVYSNWSVSDILWWDGINLAMTSLGFMNTQHHIAYHSVLVFELVQALLRLHLIHPVIQFSGRRAKEWPGCWWTTGHLSLSSPVCPRHQHAPDLPHWRGGLPRHLTHPGQAGQEGFPSPHKNDGLQSARSIPWTQAGNKETKKAKKFANSWNKSEMSWKCAKFV